MLSLRLTGVRADTVAWAGGFGRMAGSLARHGFELVQHRHHQAAGPAEQAHALHSQFVRALALRSGGGEAAQFARQRARDGVLEFAAHGVKPLLQARQRPRWQRHCVQLLVEGLEQRIHP